MKVKIKQPIDIDIKYVHLYVKVCDNGSYHFLDENYNIIKEIDEDYVPKFFPGEHYGDYLDLQINIETGQIMNWKTPTEQELEDILNNDK